ncbi:methylated-DNA--[protein]-cysteine S-methyltransferase [Brevundimonas sp. VNH65]|uniref:methylated-DNA--[protein]-cysteine S-methyltransferase n=1 Tax=Brevundimonas sp. VNH65 TaxID=3400917 RepID=UPI003C0A2BF4
MTAPPDNLPVCRLDSPIGALDLAFDPQKRLRGLCFDSDGAFSGLTRTMRREYPNARLERGEAPEDAVAAIQSYFAGDLSALARLPWSLDGARSADGFQARVWRLLAGVPAGTTISYAETARRAGEPQAAGVALNRNPLPLVLPCHRVVGADGSMTGFGGGLERKTWLLRHEGALLL